MSGAERIVGSVTSLTADGAANAIVRMTPLRVLQCDPVADLQLGPLGLTLLQERATITA